MPFKIIRNDITKVKCDAVVNAANNSLLGGGGVDGAIHRAAGPELLEECRTLGGCETGQAKVTGGYDMLCRYIIHTVGPVWKGGSDNEEELLRSCYRNSLMLAENFGCRSIAFPLISSGIYGYPKDQALKVAVDEIKKYLENGEMDISLVVFDRKAVVLSSELTDSVIRYIDDNYVSAAEKAERSRNIKEEIWPQAFFGKKTDKHLSSSFSLLSPSVQSKKKFESNQTESMAEYEDSSVCSDIAVPDFGDLDESFSQCLLKLIDASGMTDVQVYKKANIDRRLFSKIRSDSGYRPKKQTALAFAFALELNKEETLDLLEKAGYTLSGSIKFDVIIKYFLENGIYDIYEINQVLFSLDQTLIGA